MQPFGLVVRFILEPGRGEPFDALMHETLLGIRANEPDTIAYIEHVVEGEPDVRVFYELHRTEAALARAHAQRRHVGEAVQALLEAERHAPEQVHTHALARQLIRDLVAPAGRRSG